MDNKHERIVAYVNEIAANGIRQHDEEWHRCKKATIGGSQVASIIGQNQYRSAVNTVAQKIGLLKNESNSFMSWGNLFEHLIKTYVEFDKCTTIHGSNIFIKGANNGTSYSPDGLGVVNDKINLFEFKCPYRMIPTGKIPSYYVPQILFGLDMIPITECGTFVQAVFRRCTLGDLGAANFVKSSAKDPEYKKAVTAGIIGFYIADPSRNPQGSVFQRIEANIIIGGGMGADLGALDEDGFNMLLHLFNEGVIRAWYGPLGKFGNETMQEFAAGRAEGTIVGILPWKMLQIEYTHVDKEIGYVAKHLEKINEAVEVIKACSENESIKLELFNIYAAKNGRGFSQ